MIALLLVLVLAADLVAVDGFYRGGHFSIFQRVPYFKLQMSDSGGAKDKDKIKLPIVQLIDEKQVLVGEFICGNDLSLALSKIDATLSSLVRAHPESAKDICETYVSNIYSDEQLTDLMVRGERLLILKVYRDGCKKCAAMDPKFLEFTETHKSPRFKWLQAEISNIPAHAESIKKRLKGQGEPAPSS
jgi:hypothetical protein